MGIRMHLAVGYGLDLEGLDKSHLDELSEDAGLTQRVIDDTMIYAERYDDIGEKMAVQLMQRDQTTPRYLHEVFKRDEEFGVENKALLVPFAHHKKWHRYGDLLDIFAYEAERDRTSLAWMGPEFTEKKGTLYPYVGLMRANEDAPLGIEHYWESVYLDREEHKDAVPMAPMHLWFLLKHLKLVPEDQTTALFLTLRPTLYRWFS